MADGEGLQWSREQDPAMDLGINVEVVGDLEVVDDGFQDLINVSRGREQADLLQALKRIVFRLSLPLALSLEGGSILRGIALIAYCLRRVDEDLGELLIVSEVLEVITPQPGLGLEMKRRAHAVLHIRLFGV